MKNLKIVLAAAQSYLDDLASGLEDGTYDQGHNEVKEIENAIEELTDSLPRKFDELPENVKEKAIWANSQINVDYEWWEFVYDDAKNIECEISGFEFSRGVSIDFEMDYPEITAEKIIENHGETCKTYELAAKFQKDKDALVKKYSDGVKTDEVAEENFYDFDVECDELEKEFHNDLKTEYYYMLEREYEDRTSEEQIKETLIANEYEFDQNGKIA